MPFLSSSLRMATDREQLPITASENREQREVPAATRQYTRQEMQAVMNVQRQRTFAEQAQELSLSFVPNDCFGEANRRPSLARNILAPMPAGNDRNGGKAGKPPKSLDDPYLRELFNLPLLTREQEAHLFRKMNYLKFRAHGLQEKLVELQQKSGKDREQTALAKRILEFHAQSEHVRNEIIQANLRLVVSIAKRYTGPDLNLHTLVSDGNDSLMRAVERFDFSRGFKFSTYATWAIMKNYSRTIPQERRIRARHFSAFQDELSFCTDHRADPSLEEVRASEAEQTVEMLLPFLDEREQQIMRLRFGLTSEPMILREIASTLGVTKERVRQIQSRAMAKLRTAARARGIVLEKE